jgi:hypothetical protein
MRHPLRVFLLSVSSTALVLQCYSQLVWSDDVEAPTVAKNRFFGIAINCIVRVLNSANSNAHLPHTARPGSLHKRRCARKADCSAGMYPCRHTSRSQRWHVSLQTHKPFTALACILADTQAVHSASMYPCRHTSRSQRWHVSLQTHKPFTALACILEDTIVKSHDSTVRVSDARPF